MIDHQEQRLLECIDETRLTERLAQLIRIPTVSPYSGDIDPSGELCGQLFVESIQTAMGAVLERIECTDIAFDEAGILAPHGRRRADRPNIVATYTFGEGNGPTVVLDAHMDTVAVDHYQCEPFAGLIRDGFIHGRGASDDKSSIIAMIEAVSSLLESGNAYEGRKVCCSVVDEECDGAGRGSLACLRHLAKPDWAIVMDGSAKAIWNSCTGVITAEIIVHGRAGHAAMGNSVNAIEQAVKLFPAFAHFRQARGDKPGEFNLGIFQAGDHPANVPNQARLAMNIKTAQDDMSAAESRYGQRSGRIVREFFEQCVAEAAQQDLFFAEDPPQVRWIKDLPAAQGLEEGARLLTLTQDAWQDIRRDKAAVATLAGWGDMAHFMNAGIPTLGLGCGYPGAAHSAAERVRIVDLLQTSQIVALVLHRLLQ